MRCDGCGHQNRHRARFCEECARPLSRACTRCGTELRPSARFCDECATPVAEGRTAGSAERAPRAYTPRHLAERILAEQAALEARGAPDGERKTITALFADIQGSMELLEGLDPEEARRVVDPALERMIDAVHRYEGYVAQSTGDGIFALFGAPIAHEDHAQRACYAALRMQEEMRRYAETLRRERGLNLQVRVGLNTGEVVVRSIRTDDLHTDYVPIGRSTSLAARMQGLAAPGSIVVSEHTQKRVAGYFQLESLGVARVKGVSEPVEIYQVRGVGPLRTRLEVSAWRGLTRFVGRRAELEQLGRAWAAAQAGHGQIVAVMGEAGVGKSRLFHEFKVPRETEGLVFESYSVSHGKASPYLPVVELLKDYFGIDFEDDERQRREKVTGKVLTLDRQLEDALPHLFGLLGIPDPDGSLAQMDAEIRRRRTQEAVKRLLVRETLNQPCIVVFEDLHWLDAETQAFLDLLAQGVATARMLLLVNYRPGYEHAWANKSCYARLRLDPLGPEEAEELLGALLGEGAAPAQMAPLRQLLLEKTEGNPFFIEELVQTLAEEGVLTGGRGAYRLEKPPETLHVPETVQGVLAARIDRLPTGEKALLQTLAVIGKEFPFGLARDVAGQGEEELRSLLAHLQAAEFVYEQPAFPEPEYTFKHALTHDVAYGSLLVERRRALHERTGRAIEALYADGLDEHYAELAHHWGRSDDVPKAVEYLRLAGEQALERSAYGETVDHLARGLELLGSLPETPERDRQELHLRVSLAPSLSLTRGFVGPEVEAAYDRARALCDRIGETPHRYRVLGGLWTVRLIRGDLDRARELEQWLLDIARRQRDPALLADAHSRLGSTSFWLGRFREARENLEEAIHLWDPVQDRGPSTVEDPSFAGVFPLGTASHTLWYLGHAGQSLKRSRESISLARAFPAGLLVNALLWAAVLHQHRGEAEPAREQAETVIALSERHGLPASQGFGTLLRGWVLAEQGQVEEGVEQMAVVLDAMRAMGEKLYRPYALALLAETHGRTGRTDEGLALVAEALACTGETGGRISESRLHRLRGELLLAGAAEAEAEAQACFQRALDLAREQECKAYELQAATSLARLWQRQGRRGEAHALLEPVHAWFSEGLDTRDLKQARALLDELS